MEIDIYSGILKSNNLNKFEGQIQNLIQQRTREKEHRSTMTGWMIHQG